MTDTRRIADAALGRLKWPLRLTHAGMVAERLTRGFWPVWTLMFALMAAFAFGAQDAVPLEVLWVGGVLLLVALAAALWNGIRRFRWPSHDEALERLDSRLPGRPISALTDAQALGSGDTGTTAVWQAHVQRMAVRAGAARRVEPDLRVAARDPVATRYVALVALVMAVIFGSLWRVTEVGTIAAGGTPASAMTGPSWEAWIEPPGYTGRPSLYLNDITEAALDTPEGSRVTVRLYGEPDAITVTETVSAPVAMPVPSPEGTAQAGGEAPAKAPATVRAVEIEAVRTGTLRIKSPTDDREWTLTVLADTAPTVAAAGEMGRDADGAMSQPFTATDDYGVVVGKATFTLDLAAVERRFGLATKPEAHEPLVFDLPMPITGSRATFTESLVEDASKHPFANLPVTMTLSVEDARGQTGASEPHALVLPGRRFFDPLASAVIELRRDLLWNRSNAPRAQQILRAITHRPEGFLTNERAYLMLRVAMRRLEGALAQGPISVGARDEMAEALWEIALLVEDTGLSDALARMQQAQERLSEAIRNGASPEEIQKLMDELRDATDNYIRELAENMERQGADEPSQQAQNEGQQITGDQIQQMMDEIQRLMEEGRMAEAQELLDQLQRMMENLRVTEGQGGEGQQGPGGEAMRGLQDTLRGQQGLSDDSFSELQDQFNPNAPGDPQRPGQNRGQQPGQGGQEGQEQQGEGQGGEDQIQPGEGQSLAERQEALRDQLRQQQRGQLPGEGTEEGESARRSLDEAGRAMEEAEQALRDGNLSGAIDRQAEAIENLREGLRNLGEAMAQENRNQAGNQGEAVGQNDRLMPRDPLGRSAGQNGRIGTDENLLQGEDVYRRARDILDEIRRRSGEQTRPEAERDYLRRLLDLF